MPEECAQAVKSALGVSSNSDRNPCVFWLLNLIDSLLEHKVKIAVNLGIDDGRSVVVKWHDRKWPMVSAERQVSASWELSFRVPAKGDAFSSPSQS